jgi:tRNA(Ile)-lysidine synthetase-like protein
MALMHVFANIAHHFELSLAIAHVDHRLRSDSDEDATFVDAQSKLLGLPCLRASLVPPEPLRNIEAWARSARYAELERMRLTSDCLAVCTAHHLDDQAETFLLRLCSGRFTSSSDCIETFSSSRNLFRPFLMLTRQQIDQYVFEEQIPFREDPSNASPEFQRNRVRREVIPLLRDVFSASVAETCVGALTRIQSDDQALRRLEADGVFHDLLPRWRQLRIEATAAFGEDAHLIGYHDYMRIVSALNQTSDRQRIIELGSGFQCSIANDGTLKFSKSPAAESRK